jgi:hypothetical protein
MTCLTYLYLRDREKKKRNLDWIVGEYNYKSIKSSKNYKKYNLHFSQSPYVLPLYSQSTENYLSNLPKINEKRTNKIINEDELTRYTIVNEIPYNYNIALEYINKRKRIGYISRIKEYINKIKDYVNEIIRTYI